jgi:hypothetical protein
MSAGQMASPDLRTALGSNGNRSRCDYSLLSTLSPFLQVSDHIGNDGQ